MPEESTTPDLVELTRRLLEAVNRRDFDAAMGFFATDAVWESVGMKDQLRGPNGDSRLLGRHDRRV